MIYYWLFGWAATLAMIVWCSYRNGHVVICAIGFGILLPVWPMSLIALLIQEFSAWQRRKARAAKAVTL